MGQSITLFSGYNQSENRTTNYCLLILKMLYEENPKFLAEFLNNLGGENFGENVGVKFYQQQRKKSSVPDGLIIQKSFGIYIETKNFDWFYDDQLDRHLSSLEGEDIGEKILIALSNFNNDNYKQSFEKVTSICKDKYKNTIKFEAVSFEEFIESLEMLTELPKNIQDNIEDLKKYLNENNLLPNWKNYLDVVNCARIPEEIIEGNVYMCPAAPGAYNHSRCLYFGMYREKKVEKIAQIKAIVDVISDNEKLLLWNNSSESEKELIKEAYQKLKRWRPNDYPSRVFVLDKLYDTKFIKNTPGGMIGSKQYFNISSLNATNIEDLAVKLYDKNWDELK